MADKVVRNLQDEFETSDSNIQSDTFLNVFLRIRPFLPSEKQQSCESCVEIESNQCVMLYAPKDSVTYKNSQRGATQVCHGFSFTRVFRPDTDQQSLFNISMVDMMRSFLAGQNCLIFAYGATNAGKTYTMQGFQDDPGILPRSLDVLFNSIHDCVPERAELMPIQYDTVRILSPEESNREESFKESLFRHGLDWDGEASTYLSCDSSVSRSSASLFSDDSLNATKTKSSRENLTLLKENLHRMFASLEHRVRDQTTISVDSSVSFTVWVSFCEIYNEYIYDLLECENQNIKRRPILKLAGDMRGNMYVKGSRQVCVTSADEAVKLILIGQQNLRVASTKLNQRSSRSHSIFTVKLIRSCVDGKTHKACVQLLSFCDLAGSERYAKTQSHGDRLTEAKNINTSLLVLGRCIQMLRENQCSKDNMKLIPFRESKLTHLLQNFFIKKGKVSMIVNISQDGKVFDENLHVLKYSAVAKQVRIVPDLDTTRPQRCTKVSLILAQGFGSRSSVAWSTSSSDAADLKSRLTDTVAEASDENEDDDSLEDKTLSEMYGQIESLQQELAKEKKEKLSLELEIRAEVAAEVQVCIDEMEIYYEERLKQTEDEAEELAEQRMASLMRALNRRKETTSAPSSDRDEEEISKEYEIQIRNQAETISNLEAQLKDLNSQLAKESEDNIAIDTLLSELGCSDMQDVKKLWLTQKNLLAETQALAESNAVVAAAHQSEKEILEEQLQCLREKFASEVNKTLLLQNDINKREKEFANCTTTIRSLQEKNENLDTQLLQLQKKLPTLTQTKEETENELRAQLANTQGVLDDLGVGSLALLRDEWILRYTLQQELTESNRSLCEQVAVYQRELNDLQQINEDNLHGKMAAEDKISVLKSEQLSLAQTIQELNAKVISLHEVNRIAETDKVMLEDKVQSCNEVINTLHATKDAIESNMLAYEKVVTNLQSNKTDLEKEVSKCKETIHTLHASKIDLEDQVLYCKEAMHALQVHKPSVKDKLSLYGDTETVNSSETIASISMAPHQETIRNSHAVENAENKLVSCEESSYGLHTRSTKEVEGLSYEDKIHTLQVSNSFLESKVLFCEETIHTLQLNKAELEEAVSTLKDERYNILAEQDSLHNRLELAQQRNRSFDNKKAVYETLQEEMDLLKCTMVESTIKSDVTDDLKALEAERNSLEVAKSSLEQELLNLKQKSVEVAETLEQNVSSLKGENEALLAENNDLKEKFKSINQKENLNEARWHCLEMELAAKIREINEREIEVAELKECLNETKDAVDRNIKVVHQMEETEDLLKITEKLRSNLEAIKLENAELAVQLEHKIKASTDLEILLEQIRHELEKTEAEKIALADQFECSVKHSSKLKKSVEILSNQVETIQADKTDLAENLEHRIQEVLHLQKTVENLHNKFESVQAENLELAEKLEWKIKESSILEKSVEKLHNKLETGHAEKVEMSEQIEQKIKEFSEQAADKNNMISLLKMELDESRKLEEDSACKHIRSKNKLQEIMTLFGVKTLDDIKAKMNEYEPLQTRGKHLEAEIAILKETWLRSCAQIKEQCEKMLALETEHQAAEMAYNEHISNISCELRALQEVLIEEFGSFNLKQLRKNITSLHIAKEERNLLQTKNQDLESKLQEKSVECERLLQSNVSKLQEKPCDCDDFKEPVVIARVAKKSRSRKTQDKTDSKNSDSRSGVTTRSSRRRQKTVLEESNYQDTPACYSDSSTSDSSVTSISLRSRKLYKENVSLLESSPQNVDTQQASAFSAVMKKLQRS